jgi:hypothetical protein
MIEPINDIDNVLAFWPFTPGPDGILRYLGVLVFLVALATLVVMLFCMRRAPALRPYHWIPLYSLAHTAYYVMFAAANMDIRYLYPVFILMSFYLAVGLQWLMERTPDPLRVSSVVSRVALVMLCCGLVAGVTAFRHGYGVARHHSLHRGLYDDVSPWLRSHTAPNSVVGSFNAGIVSYYSGRRVVNLDGVMNEAAIAAIQTRTLGEYIDSQGIEYLADVDSELVKFMDKFSGDSDWRTKWREVYNVTIPTYGGEHQTRFAVLRKTAAS